VALRAIVPSLLFSIAFTGGVGMAQPSADARRLSLEEALRRAGAASEAVAIAQAGVSRAEAELRRARSEALPQVTAGLSYTRTIRSQFGGLSGGGTDVAPPEPCPPFAADPGLPLADRVAVLERAVDCAARANPFAGFADLPFGRPNQYGLSLSASQNLFTGGRVSGLRAAAAAGERGARVGVESTEAQVALDVTRAYYDAVLGDRLAAIAESTLAQAETVATLTRVAYRVGTQAEFEVVRAEVARDAQRPLVIQARTGRDLAYARLKLLLDLPLEEPVVLTTTPEEPALPALQQATVSEAEGAARPAVPAANGATVPPEARAPVRQAAEAVAAQEALLRVARAQRRPSLRISSGFAQLGYPESVVPAPSDFRTDWSVTVSAQVPLFTGGRIGAEIASAEASLRESRARLDQVRELARLDGLEASARLEAAEAVWRATQSTTAQATRAYQIAEVRYREGVSSQLELTDARLVLQQSQVERARAARDLEVARVRLALLPALPLGTALPAPDATVLPRSPSVPNLPPAPGPSPLGPEQTLRASQVVNP
jgi:outer membrane protein TolC